MSFSHNSPSIPVFLLRLSDLTCFALGFVIQHISGRMQNLTFFTSSARTRRSIQKASHQESFSPAGRGISPPTLPCLILKLLHMLEEIYWVHFLSPRNGMPGPQVLFVCSCFKPAALLSQQQEFKLCTTLLCKCRYPLLFSMFYNCVSSLHC